MQSFAPLPAQARDVMGEALDRIEVRPTGPVKWRGTVPGSKSLSARALLVAALADGTSRLSGVLRCDDTEYLAAALGSLGIEVSLEADACEVHGKGGTFPARRGELFVGNAGTAMRFLAATLTVAEGAYTLDGNERMRARPIGDLTRTLAALGAEVADCGGFPPVTIGPRRLRGGKGTIPGSRSSQFISGLLMAAPYSIEGLELEVTGDVVSRSYLDLTLATMEAFGCRVVRRENPLRFSVPRATYRARRWQIEPDASSASYFFAAAAVTGGEVTVDGLGSATRQGDAAFVDVLAAMGCRVEKSTGATTVRGGRLRGVRVDAAAFPDVVPTIAAVAIFAAGTTEIRGVPHLRIKESDRIASVATELGKLGAHVREREDGLVIEGGRPLHGAVIDTWDDHRIAMAGAVAGLGVPGVIIAAPHVVAKSFPDFFARFAELGRGR